MEARNYIAWYEAYIDACQGRLEQVSLPGSCYFIDEETVLSIPRDDGEARYPYGREGYNFWAYSSGYMHSNEGLFSPFLRALEGAEPKIAFFARSFRETGEVDDMVSLLSVPLQDKKNDHVDRFCIFAPEAAYYLCAYNGTLFTLRVFVNEVHQVYMSMFIQPIGEQNTTQYDVAFYMNPYLKHGLMENGTDRWFREGLYMDNEKEPYYILRTYEERDRGVMTAHQARLEIEYRQDKLRLFEATTSRYQFVGGSRSSLSTPLGIYKRHFDKTIHATSFTEQAIWGGLMHDAYQGQVSRLDFKIGYALYDQDIEPLWTANRLDDAVSEVYRESLKEKERFFWRVGSESERFRYVPAPLMNGFLQQLKKQVAFCSTIKGYIQLSDFSLIGIRDIFQALEAYVYWHPKEAKEKMIEALSFIDESGRCPRQYALPSGNKEVAMDLRPFIDQGVWVISTIMTYIKVTKDWSLLQEICGYIVFDDIPNHIAHVSEKKSSVLVHIVEIMDMLLTHQDKQTGCIHALYGDWNDALDGLGKTKRPGMAFGTGVSVMATLQVYQNLNEMIELLERQEVYLIAKGLDIQGLCETYTDARDTLIHGLYTHAFDMDKIVHGWGDEQSYYVGSYNDPDGLARDGLTSYAFWVLSGMYDNQEKENSIYNQQRIHEMIIEAFERLDSPYGFKTFEPAFSKGTPGVGRIPNLPAGTAENGATYIHASMFGVMALFQMGESRKAFDQLYKLLPMTHQHISVSPFIMPNSYGHNIAFNIDGESMQDWQTGSSNVMLKIIVGHIIGFQPTFDGVRINPASHQPYDSFESIVPYRDRSISIHYKKSSHCRSRQYTYLGKTIVEDEVFISDECLDQLDTKEIRMMVTDPTEIKD